MSNVSIRTLRRYGESGWKWTLLFVEEEGGEVSTTHYRTSKMGDGLWEEAENGDQIQRLGTTQFSLPKNKNSAYSKIYREWRD